MSFRKEVRSWLSPQRAGSQFALAMLVVSVVCIASSTVASNVFLTPVVVLRELKLWLIASWLFVLPPSPLSLIFGCLIAVQTGAFLEDRLGRRRFFSVYGAIGLVTALAVLAVSSVSRPVAVSSFEGGWVLVNCMWVTQGLLIGSGKLSFWSLPVSGYAFAAIGVAFSCFPLLSGHWVGALPSLIALVLTFAWFYGFTPANAWTRLRSWQLTRQLSRRSSHLKVLSGDKRNMPNDSDRFLH